MGGAVHTNRQPASHDPDSDLVTLGAEQSGHASRAVDRNLEKP